MITPSYSATATERVLPRMALDFTTGTLDPRVTVTRALDTATCTNSSGLVTVVNANLPRFDYNPVTLAPKGLLIEESRTNLLLYSAQFDDAYWTKLNCSIAPDAAIAPSGALLADKVVENTTNSQKRVSRFVSKAATPTTYTFTFYAKAAGRNFTWVYLEDGSGNGMITDFNLSNGTVSTAAFLVGSGFSNASSSITAAGNGWYRCVATVTTNSAVEIWSRMGIATAAGTYTYLGNGVDGIFIWGAQLEAGAFATSYIPTTTSSLTRNGDQVSMTGTNFSSWYNGAAGTFGIEADSATVASVGFFLTADDGTNNNRFGFYRSGTACAGYVITGGATQMELTRTTIVANTAFKATVAATANNGNLAFNTSLAAGDNTITMPTVTRLTIGGSAGAVAWFGHIAKISYWPQRLLNAELQAFSK